MITSHAWPATFSSRSQVMTTHSRPPSPSAVIVRHQCPIVIAAGRSATTSTRRAPRRSPTAVAPRTAEIVLPTPGSSARRNCRPPAAARSAIASAASNWIRRGSRSSVCSGAGVGLSGLRVFSTNRPSVCGPGAYGARCAGSVAPDVQVRPDRRVPRGAVDLCAVGHVEHPQPLARPGVRQRAAGLPAPTRRRRASACSRGAASGHPRTLSRSPSGEERLARGCRPGTRCGRRPALSPVAPPARTGPGRRRPARPPGGGRGPRACAARPARGA